MTRARRAVLPALLLALLPAAPAAAGPSHHGDPLLLALGDSVAAGVGAVPSAPGYVEIVGESLSNGYHPKAGKATPNASTEFDVRNLAVPGATTVDLLEASGQVDQAVELIRKLRADRDPKNDVEVVTLTIGGNDVFEPVLRACLAGVGDCQQVTSTGLMQVGAAVGEALRRLTAAAGKRTEVVVTTYYNSLVAPCWRVGTDPVVRAVAQRLADVVLEGGTFGGVLTVQSGLNDVIRQAAAASGAQVADVYGDVGDRELVGDCLHPNAAGHEAIAEEVVRTLAR